MAEHRAPESVQRRAPKPSERVNDPCELLISLILKFHNFNEVLLLKFIGLRRLAPLAVWNLALYTESLH